MRIFCDFDGTISTHDTTDVILQRFADASWESVEKRWQQGEIGSRQCMQEQINLITASHNELNAELDKATIDPSFPGFVSFCQSSGLNITIISDGVDYFIKRILSSHGLGYLPVIANQLIPTGDDSYRLESPHAISYCPSGVCKCRAVESGNDMRIYIGDGRSDFCTSDKADLVFAKDALAEYCKAKQIAFIPYASFADITRELQVILPSLSLPILQPSAHANA